ncbi:MAG: APC family permease [Chloroflexi bacterium]|nr:APC family permease [Chloroflexota bacterium]
MDEQGDGGTPNADPPVDNGAGPAARPDAAERGSRSVLRRERSRPAAAAPPPEPPQPAPYERQRAPYADLEWREVQRGRRPGDTYVRIVRPVQRDFQQVRPDHLVAKETTGAPRGGVGRSWQAVRRLLIGRSLASSEAAHERLSKTKALAVLSSDALSSVAYATEEVLLILVLAGAAALTFSLPIAVAIIVLIILVGNSYRQTIKAYPNGGGSYIVASDNLGTLPGLVAGSALLIDYVLTVAVSVAAGVAAITSAIPELADWRVVLGVSFVALVTVANLRGVRESGNIFAVPTYAFIVSIAVMLAVGVFRLATGSMAPLPEPAIAATQDLTLFLLLRAFASGCTALTGIEAISDGVPAFKAPEWKNARATLTWMIVILSIMFGGLSLLANTLNISPHEHGAETVISQLARLVFDGGPPYYIVQAATALILLLAANTAFADFPRLSYFLARDGFLPHQFSYRGDRLAYSYGIVSLGVLSGVLLIIFGGETHALIPLYAVGVFTSFTLSQAGMMVRWWRRREPRWQIGLAFNTIGAVATLAVLIVVAVTKFAAGDPLVSLSGLEIHGGAWMVMVLIPMLVLGFRGIKQHYQRVASQLSLAGVDTPRLRAVEHRIIVPIGDLNRASLAALTYARSLTENVRAVHVVTEGPEEAERLRKRWEKWGLDVPLIILESPYRATVGPLLAYIDSYHRQRPDVMLTVLLPEFVPAHWWEHILHNQSALRLKAALFFRRRTVVTSVPYHLAD